MTSTNSCPVFQEFGLGLFTSEAFQGRPGDFGKTEGFIRIFDVFQSAGVIVVWYIVDAADIAHGKWITGEGQNIQLIGIE